MYHKLHCFKKQIENFASLCFIAMRRLYLNREELKTFLGILKLVFAEHYWFRVALVFQSLKKGKTTEIRLTTVNENNRRTRTQKNLPSYPDIKFSWCASHFTVRQYGSRHVFHSKSGDFDEISKLYEQIPREILESPTSSRL